MLGNVCKVLKATTSPAMTDIVMDCKQDIGKGSVRIIVVRSMHFSQTAYLSCFSMVAHLAVSFACYCQILVAKMEGEQHFSRV